MTAQRKKAAQSDTAAAPVATAEPAPAIATMAPPAGTNPMVVFDASQLPATVTPAYDQKLAETGEKRLVDPKKLSQKQTALAKQVVEKFNLNDTTATLTFAAAPQQAINAFLDTLLSDVKVRDVGIAGDMATQMAYGINLMKLSKVKDQLKNGTSTLGKIGQSLHILRDALVDFYAAKQPVLNLIEKWVQKSNNRMVTLDGHVKKLDDLAQHSVLEIKDLASYIVAGEIILVQAKEQYQRKREEVLQSKDVVEASNLRDMGRRIAAFETRLLKVDIAYVNAGSVTLEQIESAKEADKIEIQNISEQLLFQLPKFKTAIVMLAALADIKAASEDRKKMDENEAKLDEIVGDAVASANAMAKESQGDPLQKVVELEQAITRTTEMIQNQLRIETESHQKREEAYTRLVACKDTVGEALRSANLASARA